MSPWQNFGEILEMELRLPGRQRKIIDQTMHILFGKNAITFWPTQQRN